MESAQAIRDYTSEDIALVLDRLQDELFLILSRSLPMPPFIISKCFTRSIRNSPIGYLFNPTNPAHRATDWEADIINDFRNNPSKTELVTERHPWRPRPELVASSRRHQELPSLPRHA